MNANVVTGLGYGGLPLSVEYGKPLCTIGSDIGKVKMQACQRVTDSCREPMHAGVHVDYGAASTENPEVLAATDVAIFAVAISVEHAHISDFRPLTSAFTSVGLHLKKGAIVAHKSTIDQSARSPALLVSCRATALRCA